MKDESRLVVDAVREITSVTMADPPKDLVIVRSDGVGYEISHYEIFEPIALAAEAERFLKGTRKTIDPTERACDYKFLSEGTDYRQDVGPLGSHWFQESARVVYSLVYVDGDGALKATSKDDEDYNFWIVPRELANQFIETCISTELNRIEWMRQQSSEKARTKTNGAAKRKTAKRKTKAK